MKCRLLIAILKSFGLSGLDGSSIIYLCTRYDPAFITRYQQSTSTAHDNLSSSPKTNTKSHNKDIETDLFKPIQKANTGTTPTEHGRHEQKQEKRDEEETDDETKLIKTVTEYIIYHDISNEVGFE